MPQEGRRQNHTSLTTRRLRVVLREIAIVLLIVRATFNDYSKGELMSNSASTDGK